MASAHEPSSSSSNLVAVSSATAQAANVGGSSDQPVYKPPKPMHFTSRAEERWFSQPRIQVLVERMVELGDRARAKATTRHERKMLAKYYTDEGLKRRVKLLFEPDVVEALERIWTAADTDCSHSIEKNEYLVMHRKVRARVSSLRARARVLYPHRPAILMINYPHYPALCCTSRNGFRWRSS